MSQVREHILTILLTLILCAFFYHFGFKFLGLVFVWATLIQLIRCFVDFLPFKSAILWAYAMTAEFFAIVLYFFMRLVPVKKEHPGNGIPILLTHGYIHFPSAFFMHVFWLKRAGFGPIYLMSLGHPFRSIRLYAKKLAKKIEEIQEKTGEKKIILVGHSMGGVISSWCAMTEAPKGSVKAVITLGSPLKGTPATCLAIGPNAKEMTPNSDLMKDLKDAFDRNQDLKFYHVASTKDELVFPETTAFIEGNEHRIFEDLGHESLLFSRRVFAQVKEWIEKES